MPLKIGSLVDNRDRVTARIGHGGMAEVYEGNDIIGKPTEAKYGLTHEQMLEGYRRAKENVEEPQRGLFHGPLYLRERYHYAQEDYRGKAGRVALSKQHRSIDGQHHAYRH